MNARLIRNYLKSLLIIILTIFLAFCTYGANALESNEDLTMVFDNQSLYQLEEFEGVGGISYTRVYLNEKNDVSLVSGEIKYFTYTPETDSYFVVETYGDYDTKIQVSNTFSGTIIDVVQVHQVII